jgi:hypothetical protein
VSLGRDGRTGTAIQYIRCTSLALGISPGDDDDDDDDRGFGRARLVQG